MLYNVTRLLPDKIKAPLKKLLGIDQRKVYDSYAGKTIKNGQEGNNEIRSLLENGKPLMIARLGNVEQTCILNFINIQTRKKKEWEKYVVDSMPNNAGVFPAAPEVLERFSIEMIEHLKQVDVLGVWFNKGEKYICENLCPQAEFVHLQSLEPYYHQEPWSRVLEGKKVLVIHPFQESIEKQYLKREHLFSDKHVLPEFEIKTIKAIQSRGGNSTGFSSWFDALKYMQDDIQKIDFDVAIIGCGAYGFPLASFVKQIGKQAIHIGGATQILFGIKGKRWDSNEIISGFYNEYWDRPSPNEMGGSQAVGKTGQDYW